MHMKKKWFIILLVMVMMASSLTAYAASASDYAYVFGFDYGDGVDTTDIAAQEQMYLSNMGYIAYCNTDVDASFAVDDSPNTNEPRMNSGVFAVNGHAGPGSYQFYGSSTATYLTAIKSGGSYTEFSDIDMSDCEAALFYGCKTNSDERESTYGVLTDQAVDNGATCAFGWNKSVSTSVATDFRERMFYFMRYGYTVDDAAYNAASEMPWFDATRDYEVVGDGSIALLKEESKSLVNNGLQDQNALDFDSATEEIKDTSYKYMYSTSDGSDIYVMHIKDIPTTQYVQINTEKNSARKSNVSFSNKDIQKINDLGPSQSRDIDTLIPNMILDGYNSFYANGNTNTQNMYCKISGEVKLVRLISTEYESENGDVYYLNVRCYDMETNDEIPYEELVANNS